MTALIAPLVITAGCYALLIIDRQFRDSHARIIAALTRADEVGRV
jgi:hypothetical protein